MDGTGGRPKRKAAKKGRRKAWSGRDVRRLRAHLMLTQGQLAEELGVRQQTVSEWETGAYQPRGASERLLSIVAERAGFTYGESDAERPGSGAPLKEDASGVAV
jgi:DNA-binding transcriptional regulator YiaG